MASKVVMIRPAGFAFNEQTAHSNSFQHKNIQDLDKSTQNKALEEFDNFIALLKQNSIEVTLFEDTPIPQKPDAVFPNNWISFHENNTIILYPMLAENRRKERREDIINYFKTNETNLIDLSANEFNNIFLEGTGSIVFDYKNKIAYAALSPRTHKTLFENACKQLNYEPISFTAIDNTNQAIYHTNVLMCIGSTFAVLCKECITNKNELELITNKLINTSHEIIEISYTQMNAFTGNMYQLFNSKNESCIIMSEQAFQSLSAKQINALQQHGKFIHAPLYTIEKHGGGSARCMMADVRL